MAELEDLLAGRFDDEAIADSRLGGVTSVAALEELWHLELRGRPAGLQGAAHDAYELLTPLLSVTDAVARRALDLDLPQLGANEGWPVPALR